MSDRSNNSKPRTYRLSPELCEKLDAYSEKTGIKKTFIVEQAVEQYLDEKMQDDKS